MRSLVAKLCILGTLLNACSNTALQAENKPLIFFIGSDPSYGKQLWQSDSTTQGTRIHAFLTTKPNAGSNPYLLGSIGALGIFSAFTPETGQEVWRTDGSAQGTFLLKDLVAGTKSSMPKGRSFGAQSAQTQGNTLVFWSYEPNSLNLTLTDGTPSGTQVIKRFMTGSDTAPNIDNPTFYRLENQLYFWIADGQHGLALWRSDGSSSGTHLVADMPQDKTSDYALAYPNPILHTDTALYFLSPKTRKATASPSGNVLWRVTPKAAEVLHEFPAHEAVSLMAAEAHHLIWLSSDMNDQSQSLWQFDTDKKQARKLFSFPQEKSTPTSLGEAWFYKNQVYFWLNRLDENMDMALWCSDVTTQSTQLLATMPMPNPEYQTPPEWFSFADRLYFFTKDGVRPAQLWLSDGTAQGTRKLWQALSPQYAGGAGDSWDDQTHTYVLVGEYLVFPSFSPKGRAWSQVWSLSPKQPEKPELLGEFDDPELLRPAEPNPSAILQFISAKQRWQTDGTRAGTKMLGHEPLRAHWQYSEWPSASLKPPLSLSGSTPTWLIPHHHEHTGEELWLVTPNPQQSQLIKDINIAAASSDLGELEAVGSDWYYRLNNQIWYINSQAKQPIPQLVKNLPAEQEIVRNAHPLAKDDTALYILTKHQETTSVWQIIKGEAQKLTQAQQGYVWLFPSRQGVYLAHYPKEQSYHLEHWYNGQTRTVLKNNSPTAQPLIAVLERPQGLLYLLAPNYAVQRENNSQHTLLWKPHHSADSIVVSNQFNPPTLLMNIISASEQNIYSLEQRSTYPEVYQLARIDIPKKQLIPINELPELGNFVRMLATSQGLFIVAGQNALSLWYIADHDSKPKQIKKFSAEQSIELVKTHENNLYFNVKAKLSTLNEPSELWTSDGTPEGTRLIKDELAIE